MAWVGARPAREGAVRSRRRRAAWAAGPGDFDPVPDEVVERAKAAFERRSRAPVVPLVSDVVDELGARHVRFENALVHVDLVVTSGSAGKDLHGRVDPPQSQAELEVDGSPVVVAADATDGTFAFDGVPLGTVRLRLVEDERSDAVSTEWLRV
jgi:hypothetical protein